MRRVLMVSPHFPPDTSAGTHRVRLIAPHLPAFGFEPTVLTVDPRDYEGRLDWDLETLVPSELRVIRTRAWSPRWTRLMRVGDLGLRAYCGLRRAALQLLARETFDCVFITIYPTYPALMGPTLKRKASLPMVLDYQDPWVGSWGQTTGGGKNGAPDLKSRLSLALALRLEPVAVRAADAITAVSEETFRAVRRRIRGVEKTPCVEIPIGSDPRDFEKLRSRARPNPYFDAKDGRLHISYVGTLLPLGFETLRAVLEAARRLRERRPDAYARLQLHFYGTSNQTTGDAPKRVLPEAVRLGVADVVDERSGRVDYLDALSVLASSSAILLMGSSESHYTASKLYPALMAERPLLAVFHEESSVVSILRRAGGPPGIRLVTYDHEKRAEHRVDDVYEQLAALCDQPGDTPAGADPRVVEDYSARALAGRFARVFDRVTRQS